MTQTIYPTADVALAGWSNPTWSVVDDESDSDYSQAACRLDDQTCELHAGDLSDPVSSADHVITVRAKYSTNNSRTGQIKVELYEGTTLRATLALVNVTTSFAPYTYTLSGAEADAMTYTDIHFKVTGHMNSGGSGTSCVLFISSLKFTCPDAGAPSGQPMMLRGATVPGLRQWHPGRR